MKLQKKNVLVTGASAGIGKSCAYSFAEEGANLILFARREEKLVEIAEDIKKKYAVSVFIAQCDVRNYNEVESKINSLPEDFAQIDILINNAGLARGLGSVVNAELSDWDEMIDTNIKGLLYVTRVVAPKMVARGEGHIINIGSIAGWEVYPGGSVYCGTKHAVRAISKGMTIDLNGTNVKVTEIDPGMVETEFSLVRFHGDDQRAENVYKGVEPLTGCDVAELAVFAATRSKHVSIQTIVATPLAQANTYILKRD